MEYEVSVNDNDRVHNRFHDRRCGRQVTRPGGAQRGAEARWPTWVRLRPTAGRRGGAAAPEAHKSRFSSPDMAGLCAGGALGPSGLVRLGRLARLWWAATRPHTPLCPRQTGTMGPRGTLRGGSPRAAGLQLKTTRVGKGGFSLDTEKTAGSPTTSPTTALVKIHRPEHGALRRHRRVCQLCPPAPLRKQGLTAPRPRAHAPRAAHS